MVRVTMEQVRADRARLQNPYAHIDYLVDELPPRAALIDRGHLLGGKKGQHFSNSEIELVVRRLHRMIWVNRKEIWPERSVVDPKEAIEPSIALAALGYSAEAVDSLGQYSDLSGTFEVAGLLDTAESKIFVSRRYSLDVRRFTMAHELGHAVLHNRSGLHRERAMEGATGNLRESIEVEADKFAAIFLMPEKLVCAEFAKRFYVQPFSLTEESAFALISKSAHEAVRLIRTVRSLALLLARTQSYNGVSFYSLSEHFCVSETAMAIRIEELGLVSPASLRL